MNIDLIDDILYPILRHIPYLLTLVCAIFTYGLWRLWWPLSIPSGLLTIAMFILENIDRDKKSEDKRLDKEQGKDDIKSP